MSLLGIDVGTTGVKAAAFDLSGRPLAYAYREYSTLHPRPDWAELDSTAVVRQIKAAIGEVAAAVRADPISALSISAMGEAAVPVDRNGRILGNCILSSDARGGEYARQLGERLGREAAYRINPNILSAAYTMPKLCWLRDNDAELYRRADRFLLWDGMTAAALGCEPFVSYSHANRTLLFDVHREDWSGVLLDACGLEREKLPRCLPAGTVVGEAASDAAAELGLPPGVKVVVGGHDQCCNALGAGIAAAGRAVDGIGTYECITPVYDQIPDPSAMLSAGLNVEHHIVPGLYVSFLFNQAGSLVRWFRDTFAAERKNEPNIYESLGAEMPGEPTRLFVLPCFEPTGSPDFISDVSGVILGLRASTSRGEILKAVMEGATYYFAEGFSRLERLGIDTSELIATGGGARSDAWLQIKADVYGVPLVRSEYTECGLLGAAIVAGAAAGALPSMVEGAAKFARRGREFMPGAARHAIYRERIAFYKELLLHLHGHLARQNRMV
ncbi:MAG: hypothetical protein GX594_17955 [Pirellulaceae bacterium]|nr:hypothetical protein [Pirellulaceae bacterium]